MKNDSGRKKKSTKRILALIASLVMALGMAPPVGGPVFAAGGADVDTYDAFVEAVSDESIDMINITGDFTLTSTVEIDREVTIAAESVYTIDADTHCITVTGGGILTMGGELSVTGGGGYESNDGYCVGTITVKEGGMFVLENGSVTATGTGGAGVLVDGENAAAEIKGGTVSNTGDSGYGVNIAYGAAEISGGIISSSSDYGMGIHSEYAGLDISGGEISATGTGGMGVQVVKSTSDIGGSASISGGLYADVDDVWYENIVNITASDGLSIDQVYCSDFGNVICTFLTAIPAPVSMTAGEEKTVELAGVDDEIEFAVDSGTDEELNAGVSGNTVILAPSSAAGAGEYNLVLTSTAETNSNGYGPYSRTVNLTVPVTLQEAEFMGGTGAEGDPYQIAAAGQLSNVRDHLNANFILLNDVDLTGYLSEDGAGWNDGAGWAPIGTESELFTGKFDGNGHLIENLFLNTNDGGGLFGYAGDTAEICDLGLTGVQVHGDYDGAGGLAAKISGSAIDGCFVEGDVEGSGFLGGLVGENAGGRISNCYATGSVAGSYMYYVGGLVGMNSGTINKCYAAGTTAGADVEYVGGLVAGDDDGTVTASFYDSETSGQTNDVDYVVNGNYVKGEPRASAEMKRQVTFAGWDFTDGGAWKIAEDVLYPILRWQNWPADTIITADKNALTWNSIKGANDLENNVTADLTLPAAGASGSAISWSSDNSSYVANDGKVTRPASAEGDKTVVLTATLSLAGGNSQTKSFTLTVKALAAGGGGGNGGGSVQNETPEIKTTVSGNTATVSIPKAALQQAADGKDELKLSTPVASLSFDTAAVSTIFGEASGEVKITAAKVDASSLTDEAKRLVGDRPVYDFSVTSGNDTISEFGGNVTVSVPYTPKEGEDPDAVVIYYINAQGEPEAVPNCKYDPVTKTVSFTTDHFSQYAVGYNKVSFSDVTAGAWYENAVDFAAARGIVTGMGNGSFDPAGKLTRGQLPVMLMRAYGIEPDTNLSDNFSDAGSTYYTGYLAAAKRLGITEGLGNNLYAPDKQITRQEMFTLLYNTLKVIGQLPEGNGKASGALAGYSDAASVASWAKEAVGILADAGIVGGNNGILSPTDAATRAEMAQVLYNLLLK